MDEGAFGRRLAGEREFLFRTLRKLFRVSYEDAEDFTQQTLLKAWEYRHSYDEREKLRAYILMIGANLVRSHYRRAWRVTYTDDALKLDGIQRHNQEDALYLKQVLEKMEEIRVDYLDALLMVARGEAYETVADTQATALGTAKSRVARARAHLLELVA